MVLWECVKALGLEVRTVSVTQYDDEGDNDSDMTEDEDGEMVRRDGMSDVDVLYKSGTEPFYKLEPDESESNVNEIVKEWGYPAKEGDITWVTKIGHEEVQAAFLAVSVLIS